MLKRAPYHRVSAVDAPEDIPRCVPLDSFYYISTSEYDKDNPPHRSTYKSNEYSHHKLHEEESWDGHFVGQGGEDYGYKPK